jgi:hypothetical protein
MKILVILLFVLFHVFSASSQTEDYYSYFDQIVKIEESTSNETFEQSIEMYEDLFKKYEFVFARDAFNACQIASLIKSKKFDSFFFTCAKSGVGKNTFLNNALIFEFYKTNFSRYDSLILKGYSNYLSRIDTNLRKEFRLRYQDEQESKGHSNYRSICFDNFNRILELAEQGNFPSESVIGVNENLENGFVFATLKHYPYSYSKLKDYLWTSVRTGGTQPLSVLYVYGFNQRRVSVLYSQAIPVDTLNYKICYNLPFGLVSGNIEQVDIARKQKQVLSIETQERLENVAKKYNIDYRFGY